MKIELKNIKHFESLSEETCCFNANLYVDGKKVGKVSNRGTGGCHDYDFDMKTQGKNWLLKELDIWCKENLPRWSMDDQEYETDLELHISNLVADFVWQKHKRGTKFIKNLLKRNVVVMDDTCKEGECFLYAFSDFKKLQRDELIRSVVPRNSSGEVISPFNDVVLNTLPLDEAKKIFYRS
tara:strand:+ start:860 stop:1402 length:543 start_codon:yes stop_codon:yes gene_type:complete